MAASINTHTAPDHESEEWLWELVNVDGFVYRRKKRRLYPTALARPPDQALNPAVEDRERRKRKCMALLSIKEKYESEIGHWEHLSNTLKAMEERAKSKPEQQDMQIDGEEIESGSLPIVPIGIGSGSCGTKLLLQVEAQEVIIRKFSHLCEVGESLSDAQEEKTKQSLFDLLVWCSPRELMASLCED